MIDRTKPPALNLIDRLEIAEPEVARLDNGIPVYMFNAGKQDIVKIDMLFEAGGRFQQQPLVARFTNKMLSEGTQSYTAFEIAEKLDYFGAYLGKMAYKDNSIVSISMLKKHLEDVLPIVAEIIIAPVFPETELQTIAKKGKQAYMDDIRKVSELAAMNFNQQIFGQEHPYGKMIAVSDFDRLERDSLVEFHKQHYRPDSCKIVVAGKLPENMLSLLNRYFGKYKMHSKNTRKNIFPAITPGNQKEFIDMPKSVQSAIRIGNITINKTHEDYHKLFILNTILGGYFGSRLMKNIREDKGYTYGIYSALISFQESAAFFIISEVGSDVSESAVKEIYAELRKLRTEAISEQELDLVKKYLSGSILCSFDGPFQTSERFKSLLELNINFKSYYSDLVDTIKSISPQELLDTARNYFMEENMFELVVGKK